MDLKLSELRIVSHKLIVVAIKFTPYEFRKIVKRIFGQQNVFAEVEKNLKTSKACKLNKFSENSSQM